MSKQNNIKHEDLIMKKAMDVFAEEGLKFFGINQKVKDSSSTEIVVLEALNIHMDYIEDLERKVANKETITKQELIALTFTPIMGGKLTKAEKIIKSIQIVKSSNNEYKYDIESMLYAFADKFLKGKDLQKVKEEISMTELGRMLIEDGIEKGIEKGKSELLIKMLVKKFKNVPDEYREKIKTLPQDVLEVIGMDIFEMQSIDDLKKYF